MRGLDAVLIDRHLTKFPGCIVVAGIQFAIDDNAASKACAQKTPHHGLRLALQFNPVDAQGEKVAIIFNKHRNPQLALKNRFDRHIIPADIVGVEDSSLGHHPRNAKANRTNLFESYILFRQQITNDTLNAPNYSFLPKIRLGFDLEGPTQAQGRIKQAGQNLCAPYIYAHVKLSWSFFGHVWRLNRRHSTARNGKLSSKKPAMRGGFERAGC